MSDANENITGTRKSRIQDLIARGREQGYLTFAEVNDHLPEDIADPEQVEEIIRTISEMGIPVSEQAPDAEELLLSEGDSSADEQTSEEAVAVLTSVETDLGRTTDPVRMYMREMGTVDLLTREGEIVIAKRIEDGIREVMAAVAHYPGSVDAILNEYDRIIEEEGRITDLMSGFLDEVEDPKSPEQIAAEAAEAQAEAGIDPDADSDDDDDDDTATEEEEGPSGPDMEEVAARFELIRTHLAALKEAIAAHGRGSKQFDLAMDELLEVFCSINWCPGFTTTWSCRSKKSWTTSKNKNAKSRTCVCATRRPIAICSSSHSPVTRPIKIGLKPSVKPAKSPCWTATCQTLNAARSGSIPCCKRPG